VSVSPATSLADVLPSTLAALGVPGEPNVLGLTSASRVVVVVIDGLGWNQLRASAAEAPFLTRLDGHSLAAGFPTTTVASLASLGVGAPSGAHGLVGYTTRFDGQLEPVNWLRWTTAQSHVSLLGELPPERVQPQPTAFERAEQAGVNVSVVLPEVLRNSGLTRAALRGGTYVAVHTAGDVVASVAEAARAPAPNLVYCYLSDLDTIGHMRGWRSEGWRVQLAMIDQAVAMLAERLPADARLIVTADHGMVDVADNDKIDYDSEPGLSADVQMIAGEPRVRYVYTAPDDIEAVRARWQRRLGDRMDVVTRAEAVEQGWFGPAVTAEAAGRIGDLIVVATGPVAVVRTEAEHRLSGLRAFHGARTDDDTLVPLLRR
jgi:predicted AlkP superfamily pyrophosphatase or phosphodiesterase